MNRIMTLFWGYVDRADTAVVSYTQSVCVYVCVYVCVCKCVIRG